MHIQISVYNAQSDVSGMSSTAEPKYGLVSPSKQHIRHILFVLSQIQRVCYCVFYHRTPLHYAAASRHFQCLETLVFCGTCINATDQWGRSALHHAAASDLDRRYRSVLCHVFFPC